MTGFTFRWEGIFILIGVFVTFLFIHKDMKANGYTLVTSENILLGSVLSGVFVGRLGWYIFNGFTGFTNFLLFYKDGFNILAGVAGIAIFLGFYCRRNFMSYRRTLDAILPHLLLGLAIARAPYCFSDWHYILIVGIDMLGYLLLAYIYPRFFKDKHRGDRASLAILWIGASRFFVEVATQGKFNVGLEAALPAIITSVIGLAFYICNRVFKIVHKPLVLFDFDGTLMDTTEMVNESYRYLFDKYKTVDEFDSTTRLEIFNKDDQKIIESVFTEQDPKELTTEFHTFQENLPALGLVNTMPHAVEVLMWLKRNDYGVGVVTSRPTDNCRYWIEEFDLEDYVDMVMGSEIYRKAKPAPDAIRRICHELGRGQDYCVYIGDRARDIRMARRAGVYSIGYVTSAKNEKRMAKENPNRTIRDLNELCDILQETDHNWTYNCL